ncbi:hypothetical protein A2U01_0084251, partial [Trifolium medium]|nr:hypothetical protein [Trifolium medium]
EQATSYISSGGETGEKAKEDKGSKVEVRARKFISSITTFSASTGSAGSTDTA